MIRIRENIISLMLCFIVSGNLSGQDSLMVQYELKNRRLNDSARAVSLLDKALTNILSEKDDSAMHYVTLALTLSTESAITSTEASCYETLASLYDKREYWEETVRNLIRALSVYSRSGNRNDEARILKKLGEKYFLTGVYRKSAQYSELEYIKYDDDNFTMRASAAEMAARSYFYLMVDSLSLKWYNTASINFEKVNDVTGLTRCMERSAQLLMRTGNYELAFRVYEEIIPHYSDNNDYLNLASISRQKGILNFRLRDIPAALGEFENAKKYASESVRNDSLLTDIWSDIAICHQNLGNEKDMLQSFNTSLRHALSSGRTYEAARIERILATIYFHNGDNYHAEVYCLDCIESAKNSGNFDVLQLCYKDYSDVLEAGNDFVNALQFYEKYLNLRDSLNYERRLTESSIAVRVKDIEDSEQRIRNELADEEIHFLELKTLKAESSRRDNEIKLLINERALERSEKDRLEQSLILEKERYELGMREQDIRTLRQQQAYDSLSLRQKDDEARALATENQLLETERNQQEMKAQKEKQIRKMAVGLGILVVIVAIMILAGLISTRRQNQLLAESKRQIEKINSDLEATNAEVLKQKEIIEQKNQSITDSIQYASRIQAAVLPPSGFITEWGYENFILYKPKDIVSGDFFWGVKKNNRIIIAAGDCTGHGVPGAFMSMLGHAFLDEIINTREYHDAATILNYLRDEVINTLRQKGTAGETRDGMDISLIIIDPLNMQVDYAGANNPFILIRGGEMKKYQADRMPIGIHFISFTPFTNHKIDIIQGDIFYMFSDGYADQFGGPNGRKFMYKRFHDLLLKNHLQPLIKQKEILDTTFENWKNGHEQVDDVMVIGIRI